MDNVLLMTSHFGDQWDLMNRGSDPDSGQPMCHVRHVKEGHATVHRLVLYPNGWRHVARLIGDLSAKGWVHDPERRGKKLSNSRIDLTLLSFAEHGHGAAYV